MSPKQRMEVLLGRLGELAGQRNAIDGEIVDRTPGMEAQAVRSGAIQVSSAGSCELQ